MLSLGRYFKFGIYAAIGLLIVVVYVRFKTLTSDNARLNAQLTQSAIQVSMQTHVIEQISDEREQMNALLLNRAKENAQNEEKLRNEIKDIQTSMRDSVCVIPPAVTERLRESY